MGFLAESEQERRSEKMGIVCLAGSFCRISSACMDALPGGRMGERTGRSGTGAVPERVAGEKVEKNRKNLKISVDIWRVECYTNEVGW